MLIFPQNYFNFIIKFYVEVNVCNLICSFGNELYYIYNIGTLTVNVEFMWRGLETGERRALAGLSICFVPSHINSIFTVSTSILYLSCNKICKKMLSLLV